MKVNLLMSSYRLDRSAFKAQTVKEAANHSKYYIKLTWQQRLEVAAYLNSIAFDYLLDQEPRIDKTKFKVSARQQ